LPGSTPRITSSTPCASSSESTASSSALPIPLPRCEVEAIGVLPGHRGQGIGSALLDAVDREFEALGVRDVILGVLPGNTDAMRLYARRGFTPTWLYMSRLAGR